jgi:phosphatidylglycerophosphate synthase
MSTSTPYTPKDRRPIAARNFRIMHRIAEWLATKDITANQISIFGLVCGVFAGVCLTLTAYTTNGQWLFWLLAAVFIELRLLANLFDGMVAILQQKASPLGELYNEAPDRVSDAAVCIGLGCAAGSVFSLGMIAALLATWTAYVRAIGAVAGAKQHYSGIMAKQTRMQIIVGMALLCMILSCKGIYTPVLFDQLRLPVLTLLVIIFGCISTIVHRFSRIAADLRANAASTPPAEQ